MALSIVFNPFTGKFDYINSASSSAVYNLYKVAVGATVDIPDGSENICTTVFTVDGVFQVTGKNTVL